jgi:hypothetical protein
LIYDNSRVGNGWIPAPHRDRRQRRGCAVSGPQFQFNEATSFQIPVETQAEVDRFADALSAVPEAEQCGWVKDRFGVSWQFVPRQLIALIGDTDRVRAKQAFDAMIQMKRIDIAAIERAADNYSPERGGLTPGDCFNLNAPYGSRHGLR